MRALAISTKVLDLDAGWTNQVEAGKMGCQLFSD
jgi:hypothetical protein